MKGNNTEQGAKKDHTRKARLKWKMCKVRIDLRKKKVVEQS